MEITLKPSPLSGTVDAPPSKSMAHRVILSAALAKGQSIIENIELSEDIRATLGAVRAMGAEAEFREGTLTVAGPGRFAEKRVIDCGESGTTLRLIIPVLAALGGGTVTGRGRLPQRPLQEYLKIFDKQSVAYTRDNAGLPLTVGSGLKSGVFALSGAVSSQYVSGLLFALPLLAGDSEIVIEDALESGGYVDMTVSALRRYGITVEERERYRRYAVPGAQAYRPCDCTVEGDWSQAAFFLLAGACGGDVAVRGLKRDSLQKDSAFAVLLKEMGAELTEDAEGIRVKKSRLKAIRADVSQTPDIAPALAGAMAIAEGRSVVTGGSRLKVKESDRIAATAAALNAIGARVTPTADGFIIDGVPSLTGGASSSHNDHRIAMTLACLSPACESAVTIADAQAVDKSYPSFFIVLNKLGSNMT
jgi:3-phosphoshikimate 1-carboxyvinyltransferase